jgi:hypothetical protein
VPARSIVVHPGFVNTDLEARKRARDRRRPQLAFFQNAVVRFGMSPARGALALLRAATDPSAVGGALSTPRWVNWGLPIRRPLFGRSRSRKAMTTLWEVSERETGVAFDVPRASNLKHG